MPPLPQRPHKLSLGSLEQEVLEIIWLVGETTAKEIHEHILSDPDRELAYASVSTVLKRLVQKGWLERHKQGRGFVWRALLSQRETQILRAHNHLQQLLQVGSPDIVAAFADELDRTSAEKFDAMAQRLRSARQQRKAQQKTEQAGSHPQAHQSSFESNSCHSDSCNSDSSNLGCDRSHESSLGGNRHDA